MEAAERGGKYTPVFSPVQRKFECERSGLETGIRIIASDSLLCMKGKRVL